MFFFLSFAVFFLAPFVWLIDKANKQKKQDEQNLNITITIQDKSPQSSL